MVSHRAPRRSVVVAGARFMVSVVLPIEGSTVPGPLVRAVHPVVTSVVAFRRPAADVAPAQRILFTPGPPTFWSAVGTAPDGDANSSAGSGRPLPRNSRPTGGQGRPTTHWSGGGALVDSRSGRRPGHTPGEQGGMGSSQETPPAPNYRHGEQEILLHDDRPQERPAKVHLDEPGVTERTPDLILDGDAAGRTLFGH